MPNLLDRALKKIRGDGSGEEPPSSEEIAEVRGEIRNEIDELEAELQRLSSDQGRREALAEAERPEDIGDRRREIEDRLDYLRGLNAEYADQQERALVREFREEYDETLADIPEMLEEIEEARQQFRRATGELSEALKRTAQVHAKLKRKDGAPDAYLHPNTLRKLEREAENLPKTHRLDYLEEPPPVDSDEPRVVYNVAEGTRVYLGDWSDRDPRRWSNRGPGNWREDYRQAEGVDQ